MKKSFVRNGGFSFVEVIFSIFLISVALLLSIGVYYTMFKNSEKNLDLTTGSVVAESVMANFLYNQEYSTYGLKGLPTSESTPPVNFTTQYNNTTYYYEIKSYDVGPGNLRKVDVTVYWWQSDATNAGSSDPQRIRKGYGKVYATLSRLVYVDNFDGVITKPGGSVSSSSATSVVNIVPVD